MPADPPSTAAESDRLDPATSDTTRYLCAATYLNDRFADAVLDEVALAPHRAVAPSHAFSLIPVLRHAFAARKNALIRDVATVAVLTLALAAAFGTGIVVILNLVLLWFLVAGIRLVSIGKVRAGITLVIVFLLIGPVSALVLAVALFFAQRTLYGSFYDAPLYYDVMSVAPPAWGIWALALLLIWGIALGHRLWTHRTIAIDLSPEEFDPRRAPSVASTYRKRLEYIGSAETGNLTIYAEDPGSRPFVGFGSVVQEWSFVTPLVPAARQSQIEPSENPVPDTRHTSDGATTPFTVDELYESVRSGFVTLSDPHLSATERITDLSIRDRVFVAGRLSPDSPYLQNGQPRDRLNEPEISEVRGTPRGKVRHFQTVRIAAWRGELDVTSFVHVSVRGGMLYAEFVATALPGLHTTYRDVDTYDHLDTTTVITAAGRAVIDVIRSPAAIARLLGGLARRIARLRTVQATDTSIRRQSRFDYGCRASAREFGTDFDSPPAFQLYDTAERVGLVSRRFLASLTDFLCDHGYATDDLHGQASTVINNSTRIDSYNHVANSTLVSSPVTAGTSSSVSVQAAPPAAPATKPARGLQP